jgi:formylglycine-generating enzyme required for sulfatase activity
LCLLIVLAAAAVGCGPQRQIFIEPPDAGSLPDGGTAPDGGSPDGGPDGGSADAGPQCGGVHQACCPDSTCEDFLVCLNSSCVVRNPGDIGHACSANDDCQSGECIPLPDAGSVCSSWCATPADCVPGWICGVLASVEGDVCLCEPSAEICNGKDDDCDGIVDDEPAADADCEQANGTGWICSGGGCECGVTCGSSCVDIQSDPANCGGCGIACGTVAGQPAACVSGQCVVGPCQQPEPSIASGPDPGMMLVPAGPFWRGCNSAIDSQCQSDESPGACVTVSSFEIDTTEVTQSAYADCVTAGSCLAPSTSASLECQYAPAQTPSEPVNCVDWSSATAYCAWAGKRLPTEAEWEKSARGTDGRVYPWGSASPTCSLANYGSCGDVLTNVGSDPAGSSPYGLEDLGGSVWEWIADWYAADAYSTAGPDPTGPPSGTLRVKRGGGYLYAADALRTSHRYPNDPTGRYGDLGFRCAKSVP